MSSYTKAEAKSAIKEMTNQKGGGGPIKTKWQGENPTPGQGVNEPKKKSTHQ